MGSSTRQALASLAGEVTRMRGDLTVRVGEELLEASRALGRNAAIRSAIGDASAPAESRRALAERVFAGLSAPARSLAGAVAALRLSTSSDVVVALEQTGIRVIGEAGDAPTITAELFRFGQIVSANPDLELALASKLSQATARGDLVSTLLGRQVSEGTVAIASHLAAAPHGRRTGSMLRNASRIVAEQSGSLVATVTAAKRPTDSQLTKLAATLQEQYGRPVSVNIVVEPALVGGLRVQIGDDVIDGSIASRLSDLRLRLAG